MKIIVTRHQSLVQYLHEEGIISGYEQIVSHADEDTVRDKEVIGVLPLRLAAMAKTVTEVPLALTAEDRGKELPVERIREIAGAPVTYTVEVAK